MKELSQHVYDLLENSVAANASLVELTIRDSIKENIYDFVIKDNGKGQTGFCFLHCLPNFLIIEPELTKLFK